MLILYLGSLYPRIFEKKIRESNIALHTAKEVIKKLISRKNYGEESEFLVFLHKLKLIQIDVLLGLRFPMH